jgi:hypothetical protein
MNIKTLGLACAVAMGASTVSSATLDFEGVFTSPTQGTITGSEFTGVNISLSGTDAGVLGLYDSSCRTNCTGGDLDLATGSGITAPPIKADENTPAENYILISSDGSGSGFGDKVGKPRFTFTFDVASVIESFVLIDIDEVRTAVSFFFQFADGSGTKSFNATNATTVFNNGEDNSWSAFDVAAIAANLGDADFLKPVSVFEIQFGTANQNISGGIASVTYAPVPVPAALPLMVGALGLLGWAARRRKAA